MVLLLCAWLFSTAVWAYNFKAGGIYYDILSSDDKTVEVTFGGEDYSGNVTIPETVTYEGSEYWVTAIGYGAFYDCSGLRLVTIPNSVTSIGTYAFRGCTGLTSVTIGKNVANIGDGAFDGCNGLTSVTIPESVTTIGRDAFSHCTGLTEVTIGKSVTTIGSWAFHDTGLKKVYISDLAAWCRIDFKDDYVYDYDSNPLSYAHNLYLDNTLVTDLKIPDDITEIHPYAFCGCTSLTSVTIPNSVTAIGEGAFYDCTGLKKVYISDLAAWCRIDFKDSFNPLRYAHNLYLDNTLVTDLKIPNDITEIHPYAFEDCTSLTSVTIGESVTTIGWGAFEGCTGLTSVTAYNPTPVDIVVTNEWWGSCFAFENVDCANCMLYVPAESVEKYKNAEGWKEFGTILPIGASSITEIQQEQADEHVTVYNLQGVLILETDDATDLKTLQNGAYIVNGKKMIIAR